MKRLYVVPAARGSGLGRALAEAVVAEGRRLGYREMELDSLPTMLGAVALYRQLGVVPVAPYHDTPIVGTHFLAWRRRTPVRARSGSTAATSAPRLRPTPSKVIPMRMRDWVQLILLSILWGGTFFFVAVALKEVPPITLVLSRCLLAACALVPILLLLGFEFPRTRAGWRDFAVMAVLNNIIPFVLIFYAQRSIASGLAAVLNATTPLMSLIVMRVVAGERWTSNKLAGVLIGLAGVGVLIGPDALLGGAARADALGMLACLAATLSYGVSGWWGRRLKDYAAPVSAATQLTCSTLLLLPLAAAVDRFWQLPVPSPPVLLAMLALALLSTALAYILFFRIMASAGPVNVMLVTLLIPFTSIALGALYLGEVLSIRQIAGAAIIGLSLLVIDGRLFGRAPPPPAASPRPHSG